MRFVHMALLIAVSASPALAQRGPVIVIPGRPDVPALMYGVDISWSVIEGDFGLARPGVVTPTVIYRLPPAIVPYYGPAAYGPGYFPTTGEQPGYGRLEVVPGPNRPLPPPAQSYRRSWSSNSAPTPADLPSNNPTYVAPIIAPTFNGPPNAPPMNGSPPGQSNNGPPPGSPGPAMNPTPGGSPASGTPGQPPNSPAQPQRPNHFGKGPGNGHR
jgi:hypothetical protein